MSHRSIQKKKANRLRKALRKQLPAFIDLRHYLQLHGYAKSVGQADKLILAGKVRSDSHTLGIGKATRLNVKGEPEEFDVVNPWVPAKLRKTLLVLP